MVDLYPLKFEPILKEKIWGGDTLQKQFSKKTDSKRQIGESWEISGVKDELSLVTNGFLAGNNLEELIEVYMGDITGDYIYDKFGVEFPLLIKLIDAREDLSIQVHPGNELAKKRHNAYGKTEMWYILDAASDSFIVTGFNEKISKETLAEYLKENRLEEIIKKQVVKKGESYLIPAGTVHSISSGIVIAEIQQTSDITYRLFDWNRRDSDGSPRELNIDLAVDAINFDSEARAGTWEGSLVNETENLFRCEYFTTNSIHFNKPVVKDYNLIDSFVIYICTDGEFIINWEDKKENVKKGETVLLPAMIKEVVIEPVGEASILEIYIDNSVKTNS